MFWANSLLINEFMCKSFNISRLFLDKVVKDMVDLVVIDMVDDREEDLLWVEIFWVRLTECQQEKYLWGDSNYFFWNVFSHSSLVSLLSFLFLLGQSLHTNIAQCPMLLQNIPLSRMQRRQSIYRDPQIWRCMGYKLASVKL